MSRPKSQSEGILGKLIKTAGAVAAALVLATAAAAVLRLVREYLAEQKRYETELDKPTA